MLLVMMVAFFQVQYIVTSDAIIILNFILITNSILSQSSPRSSSQHDGDCYKDNPHDQTNQHLLAGWSAGAGGRHPVPARKGFFSQKKYPFTISDLSKSSLSFQISKIHQYYNEKLQVRLGSANLIEARNQTFPFF